ncbi:MAG: hypothetical protein O7C56_03950 [Rickettsia endosymbiont of Ixodes persulcatus]|nr:hypothetical protein [Rickettsia endosymbiont of Ixodes persulcatus]
MSTFYKNFYKKIKTLLNSLIKELNKVYKLSLAEFILIKIIQQIKYSFI